MKFRQSLDMVRDPSYKVSLRPKLCCVNLCCPRMCYRTTWQKSVNMGPPADSTIPARTTPNFFASVPQEMNISSTFAGSPCHSGSCASWPECHSSSHFCFPMLPSFSQPCPILPHTRLLQFPRFCPWLLGSAWLGLHAWPGQ